jgi:hypothetical protein
MQIPISILTILISSLLSITTFKKRDTNYLSIPKQASIISRPSNIKDSISPTLTFSNYTWYMKTGTATPGPNSWSSNNAYVDSSGRLHLKITFNTITKKWDCAEVWTTESLGFGTYEWFIEGPLDQLDKNIVLGLFNYPASPKIPDGTNEIDIEYAKWGVETNKPGNFTIWPATLLNGYPNQTYPFDLSLSTPKSTQRFTWSPTSVVFQSFNGWDMHQDSIISRQIFSSKDPTLYIPHTAEPVHLNLWLFKGMPPSNNEPVEIIIDRFQKYD